MKTENEQLIAKVFKLLIAAKLVREFLPTIHPGCFCEQCVAVRHLDTTIAQAEGRCDECGGTGAVIVTSSPGMPEHGSIEQESCSCGGAQ